MAEYKYYGNANIERIVGGEVRNYGQMTIANCEGVILHNYGQLIQQGGNSAEFAKKNAEIRTLQGEAFTLRNQVAALQARCKALERENERLSARKPDTITDKKKPQNDLAEKIDILMEANREAAKRIRELESQVDGMKARHEEWDVKPTKRDCEEVVRMLGLFIDDNI